VIIWEAFESYQKDEEVYQFHLKTYQSDVPPNSLKDPNVGPKTKQHKKKKVGAHSLTCNTLGVRRHARVLGWD
jgi:hypothetical protein